MIEHYGVQVKTLSPNFFDTNNRNQQAFFYNVVEQRVIGHVELITAGTVGQMIRINSKLRVEIQPISYIVVLGMGDNQLILVSGRNLTRVILINPCFKGGIQVFLQRRVSEPILGLVDLINLGGTGSVDDGFCWQGYINNIAADLLKRHTTHQDIVKAIYRAGD